MIASVLVWLLLATIWGSTWLFIKIGLEDLPPITFAGIRFLIASIPLVAWLAVRARRRGMGGMGGISGHDWRLMVVTGWLTFTVNYALVFWGESHISSGLAAILYTTFPMIGMLLAHWMLPAEPLTRRSVAGVLLAVLGVVTIFYHEVDVRGPLALAGSAAVVLAAGATAYAGVVIKGRGGHLDPVTLTAVQMVAGFPPMLLVGIPLEGNPLGFAWTGRAVFSLLYLALVGSSLTFVLLYWLMRRVRVTRTMLIPFFSTLIAVGLGALVLDERLSWRTVAGAAGILLGLAVSVFMQPGAVRAPALVPERNEFG
ncbi:MAG TPA: DMT family transporter [Gemmatimonadales bacterium]|nr:DMT family transporter [Gemmatimonadales bacterium]